MRDEEYTGVLKRSRKFTEGALLLRNRAKSITGVQIHSEFIKAGLSAVMPLIGKCAWISAG